MSIHKVNHNVVRWVDAENILKSGAASSADIHTTGWIDTNGWTDKKISVEGDVTDGSGSISLSLELHVSPKHEYELNQLGSSVTTDDYEAITVNASALTAATLTSYDAEDLDDLQRPFRSARLKVTNGDGSDACTVTSWIEGWS